MRPTIRELAKARWGSSLLAMPKKPRKPIRERGAPYRCHFTRTQMIRTEPLQLWVVAEDEFKSDLLPVHPRHDEHYLSVIARRMAVKPKREV